MVIHGGGVYGEKKTKTIDRWCENYENLPDKIKKGLSLRTVKSVILSKTRLKIHEKWCPDCI